MTTGSPIYTWDLSGSYPVILSTVDTITPSAVGPTLSADGTKLYVVARGSGGGGFLKIYDISGAVPTLLGQVAILGKDGTMAALGEGGPPPAGYALGVFEQTRPAVFTCRADLEGSDRVYLDQLGVIEELKYSHAYPGGAKDLSCKFVVDPDFTHRAISPGRDIGVTVGCEDVWRGQLATPVVNDDGSRQLIGEGDSVTTKHFLALGLGSHNVLNINEVIDAANLSGRHFRFYRTELLPVPPGAYGRDGSMMMDEALNQVSLAQKMHWRVDRDRCIRFYPVKSDGTEYVLRARHDIDRTTADLVTRVSGAYIDAVTGLYNVEHADSDYGETGGTYYPDFYTPAGNYSRRNFTLYSDPIGNSITAYVMQAPPTAQYMYITGGTILQKIASSQFFSQWQVMGSQFAVGTTGLAATYRATLGGPSLGTGTQDNFVHPGVGSLYATENIPPVEAVIDLTQNGSYSRAEVLPQIRAALENLKNQPHYSGGWTLAPGDLRNKGGAPVDLATVQAGCLVSVLTIDPTRNLTITTDDPLVTIGECEYDADTNTLTLTPMETPADVQQQRYIDPLTGLYR
jgi:hypothetical protein